MAGIAAAAAALLLATVAAATGEYARGAKVALEARDVTSRRAKATYAYSSLPFCQPQLIEQVHDDAGQGASAAETSAYDVTMLTNVSCKVLCRRELSEEDKTQLRALVDEEYIVNFAVRETLPTPGVLRGGGESQELLSSVAVGEAAVGRHYVHNHMRMHLTAQQAAQGGHRVVAFEVEPFSMLQPTSVDKSDPNGFTASCRHETPLSVGETGKDIVYTYDVVWTELSADGAEIESQQVLPQPPAGDAGASAPGVAANTTQAADAAAGEAPGGGLLGTRFKFVAGLLLVLIAIVGGLQWFRWITAPKSTPPPLLNGIELDEGSPVEVSASMGTNMSLWPGSQQARQLVPQQPTESGFTQF